MQGWSTAAVFPCLSIVELAAGEVQERRFFNSPSFADYWTFVIEFVGSRFFAVPIVYTFFFSKGGIGFLAILLNKSCASINTVHNRTTVERCGQVECSGSALMLCSTALCPCAKDCGGRGITAIVVTNKLVCLVTTRVTGSRFLGCLNDIRDSTTARKGGRLSGLCGNS